MADKLSWTELRRAIATRAGVSEKNAGAFLASFQEQLIEALKKDKIVKINGLGTFKVQAVAPRKSVDVTTGEEIMIDGYNKVTFAPEAGVKELVESQAAAASEARTVSEADPIQKLGAQAEEIVDILGELGQGPEKNEKAKMKDEKKPAAKKKAVKKEEKVLSPDGARLPQEVEEVQKVQEVPEEPKVEEPKVEDEEPYIPRALRDPIPDDDDEDKPKRYHFVRDTLICVVILLLLLLIGYFFFRHEISGWLEQLTQPKPAQTEVVAPKVEEPKEVQEVQPVEEVAEWHYDQLLLTENITPGSRLAWIAKKHYGDRDLWPYIYMANKDRLTNPSDVLVGTPIRVPKLTEADRDKTTAQFERIKREAEAAIQE